MHDAPVPVQACPVPIDSTRRIYSEESTQEISVTVGSGLVLVKGKDRESYEDQRKLLKVQNGRHSDPNNVRFVEDEDSTEDGDISASEGMDSGKDDNVFNQSIIFETPKIVDKVNEKVDGPLEARQEGDGPPSNRETRVEGEKSDQNVTQELDSQRKEHIG